MLKLIGWLLGLGLVILLAGAGGVLYLFHYFGRDLPDYQQLADYSPPTVTRVHAGDGRLLAEYAVEKRVFVPIEAIPPMVVKAFLSAEDKNFYNHQGVDFLSVVRAAVTNLSNVGTNRRPVGASTVTQQVAKNFLLTNEVSYKRKMREAILAFRIERAFDKERILELYLNEIYLGFGSYGVAAAALNYFDKSLDELTLEEAAFLAALPKAPNNYHPVHKPVAALARRNWVVDRLLEDGEITADTAAAAKAEPLEVRRPADADAIRADYFAEEVRRELVELFGSDKLYGGGLSVRTTLDPQLQEIADRALRDGLIAYDRRHGWRGPVARLSLEEGGDWQARLAEVEPPEGAEPWRLALVLGVDKSKADIGLADGTRGSIPFAEMKWARAWLKDQRFGHSPKAPGDVLATGDLVLVAAAEVSEEGKANPPASFSLQQIPDVNGGLVALDPHTGRVLAMSGGFSFEASEFNRVTQATRQPGSAFKPIVYLAGLEAGFTPSTLILDAPFVIDQGAGLGKWKPSNYSNEFYGPTPMRLGIEKSRNLMTVRLAQTVGMDKVVGAAQRLGVIDDMPPTLSMALGAAETTLLRLTTAYGMLVNGGKQIRPTLIDRVQDQRGRTLFRHDTRECDFCSASAWDGQAVPQVPDDRVQVADPRRAYQIVSMLEGVVQRGTGRRIAEVGKPLAGKTGTTNDSMDTWFVGFAPDLAVGVFIGFDEPRPLGSKETGSSVSAPVFKQFMAEALADQSATPFRIPPGLSLVRVNAETGQPARPGESKVILEAYLPDSIPTGEPLLIGGSSEPASRAGEGAPLPTASDGGVVGASGIY